MTVYRHCPEAASSESDTEARLPGNLVTLLASKSDNGDHRDMVGVDDNVVVDKMPIVAVNREWGRSYRHHSIQVFFMLPSLFFYYKLYSKGIFFLFSFHYRY